MSNTNADYIEPHTQLGQMRHSVVGVADCQTSTLTRTHRRQGSSRLANDIPEDTDAYSARLEDTADKDVEGAL